MKQHTTNYINTFIEVSEDCPVSIAEIPRSNNDSKTVAQLQYELIAKHPYRYDSDDILFQVHVQRNKYTRLELNDARLAFFSKGQPCLRASALTKRYGFGIHANEQGKVALYKMESQAYAALIQDPAIRKVKAMRNAKK